MIDPRRHHAPLLTRIEADQTRRHDGHMLRRLSLEMGVTPEPEATQLWWQRWLTALLSALGLA